MAYRRGEVVLLPFPFTDQTTVKKRPAVVLSTDSYNMRRADVIVAPLTSNLSTGQPDDIVLNEWAEAGLPKPSVAKGILGTIEQPLIIRRMGSLSPSDMQAVEQAFAKVLGLANPIDQGP